MAFCTKGLQDIAEQKGFNISSFKIGWYNDNVGQQFQLPYAYNTLALIFISNPDMFELNFMPHLKVNGWLDGTRDPLDQSILEFISTIQQNILKEELVDSYYDYEICPRTRRPKILMQTAGHAAGAAFFYQHHHAYAQHTECQGVKKQFGVSIHPIFGGWFAFRAVLVLPSHSLPEDLAFVEPPDVVPHLDDRIRLLKYFNENWQDNQYRDIIVTKKKYSDSQQKYFSTVPKDRKAIVDQLLGETVSS